MTTQEADAKCSELFGLMKPHVATNVMQRVNLYVVGKAGKKLPEFIASAEAEVKAALIDELIAIVKGGEWDKLPAVPNGQASTNGHKAPPPTAISNQPRIPTPIPNPTPTPTPLTPAAPVVVPAPAPVVVAPKPKLVEAPAPAVVIEPVTEETEAEDPLAIITAQLAKLTGPKVKTLTEEEVRKIVRQEMGVVFKTIFEVLMKK